MSQPREELIESTQALLRSLGHARTDIATLHVPGRIEVFGKHTDYCGGRSLLAATEQGLCFGVAPRSDQRIRVRSTDHDVECEFDFSDNLKPTVGHWSNYPMTVARRVARNFPTARTGCDIAIASNLPPAAGLSSSSAMIIGTYLALDRVNALRDTPEFKVNIGSQEELAAYLGSIENGSGFHSLAGDRGVGTSGGSQDHTAILCCRADTLSQFAFCPVRHEQSIRMPNDLCFVIGVSGIVAEKTGAALGRYNAVADSARTLVRRFNEGTGMAAACLAEVVEVSLDEPETLRRLVAGSPQLAARLEQFVQESGQIIPAAAEAISSGDWMRLGELADQSQTLAERCLGNQVPETIALQRTARKLGAIASSAFGAGFGGSVWALVPVTEAKSFRQRWAECPGTFHITRASDGVSWVS